MVQDTTNNDFEIEINNKRENVTIVCNAGFYIQVAVPALQALATGRGGEYQGIIIQCQDIVGNFDATMAHQNTVMFFHLLSQNKSSLGRVRIHLHHTVRKIQLQGGAIMPNKTTAPVWFLDQVLRDKFTKLSSEKSMDIESFNQAVGRILTSCHSNNHTPNICAGCNIQFSGRSSPEYCNECRLSYHKHKCFPSNVHACRVKRRTQSTLTVNPPQTSIQTPVTLPSTVARGVLSPTLQQNCTNQPQSAPQYESTSQDVPPGSGNRQVSNSSQDTPHNSPTTSPTDHHTIPALPTLLPRPILSPQDDHQQSTDNNSQVQSFPLVVHSVVTTLNPNATPYVSQATSRGTSNRNTLNTTQKPRGKNKDVPPTDKASTELEFVKLEVSTLQARLQKQENELKDLRFRNTILLARNKSLEELKQQEIHEKYFPSHSPPTQTSTCPSQAQAQAHGHCSSQACRLPPTCLCKPLGCSHQYMCTGHKGVDCSSNMEVIFSKIEDLAKSLLSQQQVLDSLLNATTSPYPSTVDTPTPADGVQPPHNQASALPPTQAPAVSCNQPSQPVNTVAPVPLSSTQASINKDQLDTSTISLDGFIFEDECTAMDLN